MITSKFIVLALITFSVSISGHPVGLQKSCNQPFFSVIGKHYTPKNYCDERISYKDEAVLIQKYYRILSKNHKEITKDRAKELIEGLLALLRTPQQDFQDGNIICTACKSGIETIQQYQEEGKTAEEILELVRSLCTDFNIQTGEICDGLVEKYGAILVDIIPRSGLEPLEICSFIFDSECGPVEIPEHTWEVPLPDVPKPPLKDPELPPESAPKLKVLHLSDVHFDMYYKEGTWAECGWFLCCREGNELPDENALVAGKWGGWKCDTTERTLDNLLNHIATEHPDIDYIIWTGDLPAHDIWGQTQDANLKVLKSVVAKMSDNFPNTPIFPALGNHESVPANMYIPPAVGEDSMNWLYDTLADQWSRWLPENASNTIRHGGFYTTLIRPGLRVISMNMNYCYSQNWWLMLNSTDPAEELKWLIDALQTAETNNEKVHIIGHVPAGHDDCIPVWQKNFFKIINRYEATVTAQFYGHTHYDEFEVFYDLTDNTRAIAVAYIGPSVTTYTYLNPGYRIYYVDGDRDGSTRMVLDHETWILDLEQANRNDNPIWSKLYTAKEAYNITSLLPSDWDAVYRKLISDDETLQLYHRYYWKDSPMRPDCNETCKKKRLCDIRSCMQYEEPSIPRI